MKTLHSSVNESLILIFKLSCSLYPSAYCIESLSELFCLHFTMATVATKRKLRTKSIKEKYAALKGVEEESPKFQVSMKNGIPKNTLPTWFKSKELICEAMQAK